MRNCRMNGMSKWTQLTGSSLFFNWTRPWTTIDQGSQLHHKQWQYLQSRLSKACTCTCNLMCYQFPMASLVCSGRHNHDFAPTYLNWYEGITNKHHCEWLNLLVRGSTLKLHTSAQQLAPRSKSTYMRTTYHSCTRALQQTRPCSVLMMERHRHPEHRCIVWDRKGPNTHNYQ